MLYTYYIRIIYVLYSNGTRTKYGQKAELIGWIRTEFNRIVS